MNSSVLAIAGITILFGCSHANDRDIVDRKDQRPSAGLVPVVGAESNQPASRPDSVNDSRTPARTRGRKPLARSTHDTGTVAYAPGSRRGVGVDTAVVAADTTAISDTVSPVSEAMAPGAKDTTATQPQVAPAPPPENRGATTEPTRDALPVGTEIHASLLDSLDSRHDSAGKLVTARVTDDERTPDGKILISAGSQLLLTVTRLEPARSRSASDGKLALRVDGIMIDGRKRPVSAEIRPIPHELRGRGVTAGEAEKVGVGAAAGAVLGRVIGKNTKGAVIGGAVGAAGGAVVASQTASRDVVVKTGTQLTMVLTAPLIALQP
jgi:hypothetical protein